MLRFIVARLGVLIPTFIGVTIVAFLLIRLIPGDPIELLVGERGISPERHAMLREQFGFDKPLWQQYLGLSRRARAGRSRQLDRHPPAGASGVPDPVPGDRRAVALRAR